MKYLDPLSEFKIREWKTDFKMPSSFKTPSADLKSKMLVNKFCGDSTNITD